MSNLRNASAVLTVQNLLLAVCNLLLAVHKPLYLQIYLLNPLNCLYRTLLLN
jgi:hypothetical protein